jgi:predicted DNA-binding transcriptional regulator AlpA
MHSHTPDGKGKRREVSTLNFDLGLSVSRNSIESLLDELRRTVKETVREELAAHISKTRVEEDAAPAQQTSSPVAQGVELPPAEQLKAKDLRMGLLLGKIPEDAGLLIDAETTARFLGISARTLERLVSGQSVPPPILVGGRIRRWRLAEVLEWIEAGCPHPKHWSYNPEPIGRTKSRR